MLAQRVSLEKCLSGEPAPRRVGDGFREAVVVQHPRDVQLLQDEDVVLLEDLVDELVLEVLPLTSHVEVEPREPPPELYAALRALLLRREVALDAADLFLRPSQEPRMLH